MLKGNNKGFAITAVLYGLSIMGVLLVSILMATLSNTQIDTKDTVREIEQQLNAASSSEIVFTPVETPNGIPIPQEFVVPTGQSGYYRIELWGSQGNNYSGETEDHVGGYGAYTSGIIYLEEDSTLYFFVGKQGGWATEVRRHIGSNYSGAYTDVYSAKSRIMVAAGGGGASDSSDGGAGGTLYGYSSDMNPLGGHINIPATGATYGLTPADSTPTSHYTNGTLIGNPHEYHAGLARTQTLTGVQNPVIVHAAGGVGYYSGNEGIGGTSYISGYAGVVTIRNDKTNNAQVTQYTGNHISYYEEDSKRYVFLDGKMYAGVNEGDGRAMIERISDTNDANKLKRNSILKDTVTSYKYLGVCNTTGIGGVRFVVISNGERIYENTIVSKTNGCYVSGDISGYKGKIDEIAIWYTDSGGTPLIGTDITNSQLLISTANNKWTTASYTKTLISTSGVSETLTAAGIRVSAYQTDYTSAVATGDYYIMPITADGKVLTAAENSTLSANPLTIDYLKGSNRQKWKIEKLSNGQYKIMELARYKAMSIGVATIGSGDDGIVYSTDENEEKNYIVAYNNFNNYVSYDNNKSQIWKITPYGDGTYIIATSLQKNTDTKGNVIAIPNNDNPEYGGKIILAKNNNATERFRLISIDYGSN